MCFMYLSYVYSTHSGCRVRCHVHRTVCISKIQGVDNNGPLTFCRSSISMAPTVKQETIIMSKWAGDWIEKKPEKTTIYNKGVQ